MHRARLKETHTPKGNLVDYMHHELVVWALVGVCLQGLLRGCGYFIFPSVFNSFCRFFAFATGNITRS